MVAQKEITVLETERLVLKSAGVVTTTNILNYLKENWSFFEAWMPKVDRSYFTMVYQNELRARNAVDQNSDSKYVFYLHLKNTTEIIGDFAFSNLVRGPFQSAHLGYRISEKFARGGYMTEALQQAVQFAFEELNLHRIEANILPENKPSIGLIEKLGFSNIGVAKEYMSIAGNWEDHLQYQLINSNWKE